MGTSGMVLGVLLVFLSRPAGSECPRGNLDVNVAFVNSHSLQLPTAFDEFRETDDPIPECVRFSSANLDVWKDLRMPHEGWTQIQPELRRHGRSDQIDTHVVVGPYYTNLAMMLEQLNITYLVTAGKGYDWTDMNRVDDTITWNTMVELTPSSRDQNRAVVDLFLTKSWMDAIMIMPEETNNEECKDLTSQMIDKKISLIPISIPEDSALEIIQAVLRSAQLLSKKQIIICSPSDHTDNLIFNVLYEAKRFNMFDKEDLVFTIVEPYSLLRALSGMNNTYKLGLFGIQSQLLSFRYIHPQLETPGRFSDIAADTALVIGRAVRNYLEDIDPNDVQRALTSPKLLNYMKKVGRAPRNLTGRTGPISFNERGQRTNFTLHLYRHGGEHLFQKIGEWRKSDSSAHGQLTFDEEIFPDEPKADLGIFPPVVDVTVVLDAPFVIRKDRNNSHRAEEDTYVGFSIDLLKRLAKDLHFNYRVYQAPNNSYGVRGPGGWTGMVGEILRGHATFALGALTITSDREDYIDFTHGIMTSGSNILIPKPRETWSIFQFLKPFSTTLWCGILGAFFVLCAMFYVLDSESKARRFTPKECLWFCLGVLLMRGTDFSPKSTPQRILTTGYIFFALITVSTYTANMAAFLTTVNLETEVASFQDLAYSDALVPLTVSNSSTMLFLRSSKGDVIPKIWEKIVKHDGVVPTAADAIRRVGDGGHAFIFDNRINEYAEETICRTMSVGVPVLRLEHGIGLPAGAPYKRLLDIEILKLQESGYINMLIKKWWRERRKCDRVGKQRNSQQANFQVSHMAGIFIVGCAGLSLSLLFFLSKKLYLCIHGDDQHNVTPDDPVSR